MIVMGIYVLIAMVGEVVGYGIGLLIDREIPDYAMILYMVVFFGILFGAWPIAVRITEKMFPQTA